MWQCDNAAVRPSTHSRYVAGYIGCFASCLAGCFNGGVTGLADETSVARARRRGQLAIAGSAIAWSTAGALQRELSVDTATQMAGRAFVAAVVLSLLASWQASGRLTSSVRSIGRMGVVLAVCMAGASAMFIVALNRTTVANVLLVQALAPFIAVLLAWMLLRETASRRTWMATVVALIGVGIMVGGPESGPVMGVFQTGIGQALFVIGARLIAAAEVALITMLEVVLGPFWVWLAYSEEPGAATLLGGVIVLAAVVVQTTEPSTRSAAADDAVDLAERL
jgi:drug/metabolite transporter (DMT)-like permease